MSVAIANQTSFFYSSDGGATYVELAGITNISGPSVSRDAIEVTTLADNVRKFIGGLKKAESLSLNLQVDMGNSAWTTFLGTVLANSGSYKYRIVFTSALVKFDFDGILLSRTIDNSVGALRTGVVTIQPTSDFTQSSAPVVILPAGVLSVIGSGTVVTVATLAAHGLYNGQSVTISGATASGFNATATITVTGTNSFTYANATTGTASVNPTITGN